MPSVGHGRANSRNDEKVRAKNSRAQKRYREKKQDEKKELELFAERVAVELNAAEQRRDALSVEVAHLDLRLRANSYKMTEHTQVNEPIYIPSIDGYGNLRSGERPGLMLRAVYSPPKRWTYAETMALSTSDFAVMRKDIVLRAGQLLLANPEEDTMSPDGSRMKELMKESHGVTAYLAIHRPQVLYMLAECRMDSNDEPAPLPPPSFWSNILKQMRLSPDQEMTLLVFYTQLRDTERKLLAERVYLRQALVGHVDSCNHLSAFTEGLQHSFDRYRWASLVRRMQENADSIHMAKSRFHVKCSSLWTMEDMFGPNQKGINVFQDARLLTLSWPIYPRVISCIEVLADQYGVKERADAADQEYSAHFVNQESPETPYVPVCTKLIEEYLQHRFRLDES